MTIIDIEIIMYIIVLTNHPVQCNQFGKPIIFMDSFNCLSFSIAINLTVLMHGYKKLDKIINDTNDSKPCKRISCIYGGYGKRCIRISGISLPFFIFTIDRAIAFCMGRKPSLLYHGKLPSSSSLPRGPPNDIIGNNKFVRQLKNNGS